MALSNAALNRLERRWKLALIILMVIGAGLAIVGQTWDLVERFRA